MTSLLNKLQDFGFNEQESRVYIACIERKKATPTQLAHATGIQRTTLYAILNKLHQRGLIYKRTSKRRVYFSAHNPATAIRTLVEQERRHIDNLEELSKSLITSLEVQALNNNTSSEREVSIFRGVISMHELVHAVLKERSDIYWIGPSQILFGMGKSREEIYREFSVKRMDAGTLARSITDVGIAEEDDLFVHGSASFRQLEMIEFPKDIGAMIAVTGNLSMIIKVEEGVPEAVLIRDAAYASIIRFTLSMLWKKLKSSKT